MSLPPTSALIAPATAPATAPALDSPTVVPPPPSAGLGGARSISLVRDLDAEARYQAASWLPSWQDNFTADGAPDPAKWNYEEGLVRNEEAQYYVANRAENAVVSGGVLRLVARKEKWLGADYTSASLTTRDRFDFTYGKLEVRARVPSGRGTWSALWLLARDHPTVPWPDCGEIDLMEHVGFLPERFHYTVHTGTHNHMLKTQLGTCEDVSAETATGFRDYGLIWSKDRLEWFVNGRKIFEYLDDGSGSSTWPFSRPQYLLLSLAIGGSWGGTEGIDDTLFPAALEIAHVRIWQTPAAS